MSEHDSRVGNSIDCSFSIGITLTEDLRLNSISLVLIGVSSAIKRLLRHAVSP